MQVKTITSDTNDWFDQQINDFLSMKDPRQILKMEISLSKNPNYNDQHRCFILYAELSEIRNINIDSIFKEGVDVFNKKEEEE